VLVREVVFTVGSAHSSINFEIMVLVREVVFTVGSAHSSINFEITYHKFPIRNRTLIKFLCQLESRKVNEFSQFSDKYILYQWLPLLFIQIFV